ncbi:LIC_12586 family protein [Leptospira idonii]|nr:hypothetical protein [Leptospira idonii]
MYLGFEYYLKTKRIPLVPLRALVTSTINQKIGKAVDLGVVDFSLREGLILEDLVISQEEDFSFNTNLLKVKKVTFHLSSYFSETPSVDRVDFYSPQLILNSGTELENQLLDYFQSSKLKEVVFHDTRISLKKGDFVVLDWKEGWDIRFKRKNDKIYVSYDNGWFWVPNATRVKGEGYFTNDRLNEYSFSIVWKNYPSEEAPFLVNYLFGFYLQSAVLTGEAVWEKTPNSGYTVKGNVEFENANFYLPNISSYIVSGLRLQEKFFFTSDKEERNYSSYDFQIKIADEWTQAKETLLHKKIEFNVDDLEPLTSSFQEIGTGNRLPLSGKIRGSLDITESGDRNKWFKVLGDIQGENLDWVSSLIQVQNGNLNLKFTEGNNLSLILKSEIFNKPSTLEIGSGLDWSRSKKTDGSFYYPLYSRTKGSLTIQEFVAGNWTPLFESWKKETWEEIKERQEKLIPEEYFYQKKVYKYFLESMNFDLSLNINRFFPFEGAKTLGEAKGNILVKDGRFAFGLGIPKTNSKISMSSYFATKTPNFSFGLSLDAYPWSEPWMDVCGMEVVPGSVTMDYSFASQGSDYYTLSKDARINYYLKLENTNWRGQDLWTKMNLPENSYKDSYVIEFNMDHYFESDYLRNLAVSSSSVDLKGYGTNKSGLYAFSLYGQMGEAKGNWSFTEEDGRCIIK